MTREILVAALAFVAGMLVFEGLGYLDVPAVPAGILGAFAFFAVLMASPR